MAFFRPLPLRRAAPAARRRWPFVGPGLLWPLSACWPLRRRRPSCLLAYWLASLASSGPEALLGRLGLDLWLGPVERQWKGRVFVLRVCTPPSRQVLVDHPLLLFLGLALPLFCVDGGNFAFSALSCGVSPWISGPSTRSHLWCPVRFWHLHLPSLSGSGNRVPKRWHYPFGIISPV